MNNIKKIIISIISITTLSSLQMSLITASAVEIETNFAIVNKAQQAIGIQVETATDGFRTVIKQNHTFSKTNVNTRGEITITVCPNISSAEQESRFMGLKQLTYADLLGSEKFTINAKGKNVYLTWNPAKRPSLYPQTGPLMGLGKMIGMKGPSGLSLENNVSSSEIQ